MPKRTHSDAMKTKNQIIQAALKLFNEQGYAKTSLSDIAREAGVTRGAIYWHFEDKGELLYELCLEVTREKKFSDLILQATKDSEPDPLGCIKGWISMHTQDTAEQFFAGELYQILDGIFHKRLGDEKTRERILDLVSLRMYHITAALENCVHKRQLPPDLNIDMAASYLHALLIGYMQTLRTEKICKPIFKYTHSVDKIIDSLKLFRKY